jgi:hypothetical protein
LEAAFLPPDYQKSGITNLDIIKEHTSIDLGTSVSLSDEE